MEWIGGLRNLLIVESVADCYASRCTGNKGAARLVFAQARRRHSVRIGEYLSLPYNLLRGQDWEIGEEIARFGPCRVCPDSVVRRDGRRTMSQYTVLIGPLAVPWRTPLWGDYKEIILDRLGCVAIGAMPVRGDSITVVDVYRHLRRWLSSVDVVIAVYREPRDQGTPFAETWRKSAARFEARRRIVSDGVHVLRADWPVELDEIAGDERAKVQEARRQRRQRFMLRAMVWAFPVFWRLLCLLLCLLRLVVRRPVRWLFRDSARFHEMMDEPPTKRSRNATRKP